MFFFNLWYLSSFDIPELQGFISVSTEWNLVYFCKPFSIVETRQQVSGPSYVAPDVIGFNANAHGGWRVCQPSPDLRSSVTLVSMKHYVL